MITAKRSHLAAVGLLVLVFAAAVVAPILTRASRYCFNNYDLGI